MVLAFFAISYMLTLVSGWIPATDAKCSEDKPYPLSFTIYMCLYVAFGITTFILYYMNYLMDDDKIEELKQMEATQFFTSQNLSPLIQRDRDSG